MSGADLKAWRIGVNWSLERLARALGYAARATVSNWERGVMPIPTMAQLAIRWLMHITPKHVAVEPPRFAKPKPRLWTTREVALLTGFDSSPPGAILEMATSLGRSEHSVSIKLTNLRKLGLAPAYSQTGRRRGATGRKGPPPMPATLEAPKRPASLMSDSHSALQTSPQPTQWRSAVTGPQR